MKEKNKTKDKGDALRAFTVKPLWAYLILNGVKDCENRSSAPNPRSGTAYVHVSATYTEKEHDALLSVYPEDVRAKLTYDFLKDMCGQIVGVVDYTVQASTDSSWWDRRGRPIMLSNPRWLKYMIPCKGALQFWTVPADVAAEVRKAPRVSD